MVHQVAQNFSFLFFKGTAVVKAKLAQQGQGRPFRDYYSSQPNVPNLRRDEYFCVSNAMCLCILDRFAVSLSVHLSTYDLFLDRNSS
jgi:hypothetical protein